MVIFHYISKYSVKFTDYSYSVFNGIIQHLGYEQIDNVVETACESKAEGYKMTHPDDSHWFIHCNGDASRCQPCPADLIFNNTCGACLNEGEACPAAANATSTETCKLS